MHHHRTTKILFLTMLLFSTVLRFALATVNREANDDHLNVVNMIMQQKRLPGTGECRECFQPKLFHYSLSLIFRTFGIGTDDKTSQIIITQILNAYLGTIFLLVIWSFLKTVPDRTESWKLIAFSLVAFNPGLMGINAQATNDTLAILLATLAIYFSWMYLKQEKGIQLLAGILFVSLGIATKTNILVTGFAILFALFVRAFSRRQTMTLYSAALFLPSILVLSLLNPLTQYIANYQNFGSAVGINMPPQPLPSVFEKSYINRPGIVSIQDGIFSFKFGDLLKYPYLTNELEGYPAHRTSLWTQLYARANSVHFDNWPKSWSTGDIKNFALTRAIFVLALLPALMLIFGAGISLQSFAVALLKNQPGTLSAKGYGLFDALFWGYLTFIALYSMSFRDFSVMKAVFIYPAMSAFLVLFLQAGDAVERLTRENKWFIMMFSTLVVLLVILYSMDTYTLTLHLYSLLGS